MGGRARAERHDPRTLSRWSAKGGKARAEKYTPEELRAFAAKAGRTPWKLTLAIESQIVKMLGRGEPHKEISEKFRVSLRTVGRIAAKAREALG